MNIWLCLQRNYGHTKKHIVKDDGLLQASCPPAGTREALPPSALPSHTSVCIGQASSACMKMIAQDKNNTLSVDCLWQIAHRQGQGKHSQECIPLTHKRLYWASIECLHEDDCTRQKKHAERGLLMACCPSARHREALARVHYLSKSVQIGVRFYSVKAQPDWNAFFVLPRATLFAKPHEKICVLPVFRNNLALGGMLRMLTIKTALKTNRCKKIRRHQDCAVQMIFVLKNTNCMV